MDKSGTALVCKFRRFCCLPKPADSSPPALHSNSIPEFMVYGKHKLVYNEQAGRAYFLPAGTIYNKGAIYNERKKFIGPVACDSL